MIEVQNINAVNKGSLLATCDVRIAPWKFTFENVKIFEKGANRWIGLPSREMVINGETKYLPLGKFDTDAITKRFSAQIMGEIDKFLAANPEMKPEDVIKEDTFPF